MGQVKAPKFQAWTTPQTAAKFAVQTPTANLTSFRAWSSEYVRTKWLASWLRKFWIRMWPMNTVYGSPLWFCLVGATLLRYCAFHLTQCVVIRYWTLQVTDAPEVLGQNQHSGDVLTALVTGFGNHLALVLAISATKLTKADNEISNVCVKQNSYFLSVDSTVGDSIFVDPTKLGSPHF